MTTLAGTVALLVVAMPLGVLRLRYLLATVDGVSMVPTLMPGDRLLVRRTGIRRIRRGQIVVVRDPSGPASQLMVKRVAAVPGESSPTSSLDAVPPGHLYVLGDNVAHSRDSRHYGYVSAGALLGVVRRRYPLRKESHVPVR